MDTHANQDRSTYARSYMGAEGEQARYLDRIRAKPILTEAEELDLTRRWYSEGDRKAYDTLIESHLRLIPPIAQKYAGYGIPVADMIGEGSIGLMQSAERFQPEKGFRFSTYARWWIKAAILNYILQTWSLIKVGNGAAKKRLFFNLRRARRQFVPEGERHLSDAAADTLATQFGTTRGEILAMDQRLAANDVSLHQPLPGAEELTLADLIADDAAGPEETVMDADERKWHATMIKEAMTILDTRERDILRRRYLTERPVTLSKLAGVYGLTAERVRQIEAKAIAKLREYLKPRLLQHAMAGAV